MNRGFEQVLFDFDSNAIKLFFYLYDRFKDSTCKLNRDRDENVFQQQMAKYQFTLKEQLEAIAKELLEKYKAEVNITQFNKTLTERISYYLNEFKLKSTSE